MSKEQEIDFDKMRKNSKLRQAYEKSAAMSKHISVLRRDVLIILTVAMMEDDPRGARCPVCKRVTPAREAIRGERDHTRTCAIFRLGQAAEETND